MHVQDRNGICPAIKRLSTLLSVFISIISLTIAAKSCWLAQGALREAQEANNIAENANSLAADANIYAQEELRILKSTTESRVSATVHMLAYDEDVLLMPPCLPGRHSDGGAVWSYPFVFTVDIANVGEKPTSVVTAKQYYQLNPTSPATCTYTSLVEISPIGRKEFLDWISHSSSIQCEYAYSPDYLLENAELPATPLSLGVGETRRLLYRGFAHVYFNADCSFIEARQIYNASYSNSRMNKIAEIEASNGLVTPLILAPTFSDFINLRFILADDSETTALLPIEVPFAPWRLGRFVDLPFDFMPCEYTTPLKRVLNPTPFAAPSLTR